MNKYQVIRDKLPEFWELDDEYLVMTIEALDKQIPRKAVCHTIVNDYTGDLHTYYYCPNCRSALTFTSRGYCCDCGQAIDWSEVEV